MFPKIRSYTICASFCREKTLINAIHFIIAMSNKKWEDAKNVDVPINTWHADDLQASTLPPVKFQSPSVIIQEEHSGVGYSVHPFGTVRAPFVKGIQGFSLNYDDILPNAIFRVDPRLDSSLTILLEGSMNELRHFWKFARW